MCNGRTKSLLSYCVSTSHSIHQAVNICWGKGSRFCVGEQGHGESMCMSEEGMHDDESVSN